MKVYRAELHVHTVLSPCASVEMIPPLIVQTALDKGINLIAITDHNASANVAAVQQAAAGSGLSVLPGMEMQTQEEVHVLCLFDQLDQLQRWQSIVDQAMPPLENNPDYFGEQFIVDATGDYLGSENSMLLTSAHISFDECILGVQNLGGLAIPAHVNRQAFGLFANLGVIPLDLPVEALEISRHITVAEAHQKYPQTRLYPLLQSGDVHHLDDFLGSCLLTLENPRIAEIRLALGKSQGRKLEIDCHAG